MTGDGQTLVEVITDPAAEAPRCCPRCGKAATRVKERPRTAPRDVFIGDRQVLLDWRKTRWRCDTPGCEQGTFTEWLPAVKRRARLTSRLRTRLGEAVGDDLMPASAAARCYGVSDRTAARAFTAYADEQLADLDERQGPVEAAGVDEFRRGAPADRIDPGTGEVIRTRSEWLTHLVDLGGGGTLGLAQGRTAAAEKDLLTGHAATLRYLAMDLSATYRSGAPAGVTLVADAFHLVKLANRKIDDAFRRLGYRTEHAHEDLGLPRPLHYMLRYNIENLDPGHLATIIGVLDADADGQQIAAGPTPDSPGTSGRGHSVHSDHRRPGPDSGSAFRAARPLCRHLDSPRADGDGRRAESHSCRPWRFGQLANPTDSGTIGCRA